MFKQGFMAVAGSMLLLGAASCGAQCTTAAGPPAAPGVQTPRAAAGFGVSVMDESFAVGGAVQGVGLAVSLDTATNVVVDVDAQGAQGLKALYLKLNYDPRQYQPVVVEPRTALGDKADLLSLMLPGRPGELQYGQALVNPDYQVGFTGSGTVARISFRKTAAFPARRVSTPARTAASAVGDMVFQGADGLAWSYAAQGDYDQNGVVNVADLTPISKHFKEQSPNPGQPFDYASAQSQIDGDGNGEINAADLMPIALNFGVDTLGGFRVFASADQTDCPAAPDAPNGPGATELTGVPVLVGAALNAADSGTQRLKFSCTLSGTIGDEYYWIRAYDREGQPGIASIMHPQQVAFPVSIPATGTQPESGTGQEVDPYVLKDDKTYNFTLVDSVSGADLTNDPGTEFVVSPANSGAFTANVLALAPGYAGSLVVSANYNGLPEDDGSKIYCTAQSAPPGPPVIDKDPTDTNWDGVTGTGVDENNAYILHTQDPGGFNPDADQDGAYDLVFHLIATAGVGGPQIPNADLDWSAFPPFTVFNAAAFTDDATAGTFQAWSFSDGYLFAQDPANPGAPGQSNDLYVRVITLSP
jgi:hypothetical protein